MVSSQLGQIVQETLSQKTLHKNRAGEVAEGEGPDFKLQYHKKKKKGGNSIMVNNMDTGISLPGFESWL
jgi:hypothetical protein